MSAEAAWFWFMRQSMPYHDLSDEIFRVITQLYKKRRLTKDQLYVMRHYGRRGTRPNTHQPAELRAHYLWQDAIDKLTPALIKHEIVKEKGKS